MRKTSHNHSPNQRTFRTRRNKKTSKQPNKEKEEKAVCNMRDQAHMTGHRVERDPKVEIQVEIEVEIGVVDPKVEIKVLEKGGTIQELGMVQVCL